MIGIGACMVIVAILKLIVSERIDWEDVHERCSYLDSELFTEIKKCVKSAIILDCLLEILGGIILIYLS